MWIVPPLVASLREQARQVQHARHRKQRQQLVQAPLPQHFQVPDGLLSPESPMQQAELADGGEEAAGRCGSAWQGLLRKCGLACTVVSFLLGCLLLSKSSCYRLRLWR